ncbi:allantoin racemase [Desulfotomaculum arcticum]|uniref:Allantoin racemase n=1 Tax=Desulfotruncus arcticus DSM 17038 TaxID=1121424 RepID=A0A1I2RJX9_9FIRM|nr:aspartate/glutamate racemase family protein [Desulfotruncus arcticus]SFG38066.1 allantoin racemase [Desulfotomaculum arcticum] [Desulfotruncus arcticus DSM 17038]
MSGKRILFINPVGHAAWDDEVKNYLNGAREEQTVVDVISLKQGPKHLEYHYYEALVGVDLLHTIKQAENDGYDAAVIGCFYDPFLHEAREICDRMVVTAPAESSLQLASVLGDTFSIIVGRRKWIAAMRGNVLKYGYGKKLASFRSLELGVLDFHADEAHTESRLKKEAQKAVTEDGAESVILGCTMQFGFYRELQEFLGVPVIDVVLAPFKHAEFLVEVRNKFGWQTSKVGAYETPPAAEIQEWRLQETYHAPGLWDKKK